MRLCTHQIGVVLVAEDGLDMHLLKASVSCVAYCYRNSNLILSQPVKEKIVGKNGLI